MRLQGPQAQKQVKGSGAEPHDDDTTDPRRDPDRLADGKSVTHAASGDGELARDASLELLGDWASCF
jgi:hypothetical protein